MGRRIGLGIVLIAVGAGLLFRLAGGYVWNWAEFWPLILILLGVLDVTENGWRGLKGGGGFFLSVGGFFLLFTMHLVPWTLSQAWPAGLILLGLLGLLGERPSLPWAVILIGGGAFLLAVTTGNMSGGWHQLWPVILILAGLAALIGRDEPRREPRVPPAERSVPTGGGNKAGSYDQAGRLEILDRIRAGEITVDEGAALLERLKKDGAE